MSIEQVNRSAGVPGSRAPKAPFAPGHRGDGRVLSPPLPDYVAGADIADLLTEDVARPVAPPADLPFPQPRRLRAGCYLLRYTPTPHATVGLPVHYDGTLRVERDEVNTIASGDLYLHQPQLTPLPPREPDPALGVPVFPIADYRYYVRVTQILEGAAHAWNFPLGFELHRFDHAAGTWSLEDTCTAKMGWMPAPPGYPSASNFLLGLVRNAAGAIVGMLSMGWVSTYLRRITVEIDRVPESEAPLANAAGDGWASLFQQVEWQVDVDQSDTDLAEPSGESWSDAEMHATMLARRDASDLDREWRYWVVCARRLDSTERGIMFDAFGGDSNNVPREGAGIASHWTIPNADPWGLTKGLRFGTAVDAYFRTAVHELGHAMGLYHNTADTGFMNTTDVIAASAAPPQQFPQNIRWSHAPDDQKRLRHMPDLWVRPGGVAFGAAYSTAPISPDDAVLTPDGVELDVAALLDTVPIGAPVRVDLTLRNRGTTAIAAPVDLSLRAGHVSGTVTDPSGTSRRFSTLVRCMEEQRLADLRPGADVIGSLTLLRGRDGALFPAAGPHTVRVDVRWEIDGVPFQASGAATVMVTAAVDDAHAAAALRVLTTPDALVTLAIGGDHLHRGVEAIEAAIGNDVLRPHFAFIEAKRVAAPFFDRPADLGRTAELIDEETVMSAAEVDKAARLLDMATRRGRETAPLVAVLSAKAQALGADGALRRLESL
ncbi:hypothetical protein [Nocardia sp. CY41]|uniref:hypothetical protein n=1 Tax=Nocardia sp. CY41 TaxID=2608686 RepID=UPI00135C8F8A|nr:hypothetical protein [Nocardia sp. CY41]